MLPKVTQLQNVVAHEGPVNCICLGQRSAQVFATGGDDRYLYLWAVSSNTRRGSFGPLQSSVTSCRFDSSETKMLCGNNGGTVVLFDLNESRCASSWTAHRSAVNNLAFHPQDSKLFYSCGYDGKLHVLSTQARRAVQSYNAHSSPIHHVAVSYDGLYAATCGEDHTIRVFDLRAQRQLVKLEGHTDAVTCVEFHPTERLLVSCGVDRSTRFWDLEAQREIPVSFHLDTSPVEKAQFLANESVVITGSASYLKAVGWKPPVVFDNIALGLERLHDIAFADSTITFASTAGNRVLIHRLGTVGLNAFSNRNAAEPERKPRPPTPRLLDISAMPEPTPKPVRRTVSADVATVANDVRLFQEIRKSRGPFMSAMNEKFSRYTRLKDMLDSVGLEPTLASIAESGDLGNEVLLMLRRNPALVTFEHAGLVMQIAVRTFDQDHELAITTVEGMMQAFGKLVQATRVMPVPGRGVDPALEDRKRRCDLFTQAFREIAPRLRTVAAGRSGSSEVANELLDDWSAFLR
jgi:hypothetical protein